MTGIALPEACKVVPFIKSELLETTVVTNGIITVALPPSGHIPTAKDVALVAREGVTI